MRFNLKRAVDNLAKKDLKFFQPLYEAITNSLEANASEIVIDLFTETLMFKDILPHITGFSVTDNGDGFTSDNRDSFLELWSDRKLKFGCKGSGRFTWLSVFEDITIKSEVASENKLVSIAFNLHFKDDDDIKIEEKKIITNKTIVEFNNVTDRYYDPRQNLDKRAVADLDEIKLCIEQNLLIKLFLIKNSGRHFSIIIKYNGIEREINNTTIPDLAKSTFQLYSSITKKYYDFELYYHFNDNGKNSKKIYYCANDRTVKEEDDDSLNFSCSLPNQISFNMLLCSPYLDEMVNDARDEFPEMSNKKQANIACPLLFKDIKPELLKQMHLILLEKFPELEKLNKEQEEKAITASPYLAKYIRRNNDIVKSEKSLTIKALEMFNKEKISAQNRFEKLLKNKSIDPTEFNNAVSELSEVAVAELGEYVLYRNSIIKALQDAIINRGKKEEYLHNIFIPKGTIINNIEDNIDYCMTNLWLLDDKFMSFSSAFSDVKIKKIIETLFTNTKEVNDNMNAKKPDVAVFYNKDISRDALVVEFKGLNASLGEKEKAIAEISRNCLLLKDKIKEIDTIWAYIITTIDDEFEVSLRASGYKRRFTNSINGKVMYFYNEGIAHIYALDINSIVGDATARNKTFLDILKNR